MALLRNLKGGGLRAPALIFVDQQAISRNSGREPEDEEPVFVIERDGVQTSVHGVTIKGPSRLCYDKTRQPRAWLEATDIEEDL